MKFQTILALTACSAYAIEGVNYGYEYSKCPNMEDQEDLDTPAYQAMTAECKKDLIWKRVTKSDKQERYFVGNDFESLFNEDYNLKFDTVSDTRPVKTIQKVDSKGVVSLAEFIPSPDCPYTGMFQGAKHAVLRISEFTLTTPEVPKTSPGASIKFLRDGMSSGNMITRFALDGQPSFNYFKNRLTNVLKEPNNECLRQTWGRLVAEATDHIGATSLMELSQFDQFGHEVKDAHWPFQIDLEPYDVYGWTDKYQNDFQDQLVLMKPDTAVFKVLAYDKPPELGGEDYLIGWIVSRSKTVTSLWGDQKLFFQHRRYEDDIKHRPVYFEWLQFWDQGKFWDSELKAPAPKTKCPFFYLYEEAGLA